LVKHFVFYFLVDLNVIYVFAHSLRMELCKL